MVPLASSNQLVQDQGRRVLEKVLVQTNNRAEAVPQNPLELLLFNASEVLMRFSLFVSPARPTLPPLLFDDQLPEPPDPHTQLDAHSVPVGHLRRADWLLRDDPYSEGVAEHRKGGVCWDCLRFHGDESGDQPVSPALLSVVSHDASCPNS